MRVSLVPCASLFAAAALAAACGPGDDTGETCSGLVAGDLVITEVLADFGAPSGSSGADEGHEWFELHNASSSPIELGGLVVRHGRPDDLEEDMDRHAMRAVTLGAGEYLVLGNVLPDLAPAHVDYGYANDLGDLLNSGSGKLLLRCGATVIDEAVYAEVEVGRGRALDGGSAPDYQANDDLANWCDAEEVATYEYEPANYGTPGAPNPDCMTITPGTCDDGGTARPTVPPQVGDLTITEVMPSPGLVSDTAGEWIEVLVNRDLDFNDLGLDRIDDTANPNVVSSPTCLRATAGTYLVFAKNADMTMNGGIAGVDGGFSFALVPGTAAEPTGVRLMMGTVELDSMSWTSARNARSIQLDQGLTAPADNDLSTNLCDGTTAYNAMDFGTPGAANSDCGVVTTGMCMDTGLGALRPIVKPTAGQLVINEWMPDPTLVTDTNGEWFEVRATAAVDLNGLQVGTTALGTMPVIPAGGTCVPIASGGFALFARNTTTATNGMLPAVDAMVGISLVQTGGTVQIGIDDVALDTKTWASSMPGKSIMIDSDGTQCDAPAGVALYNGTDTGTPRATNTPPECP